MTAPSPSLRLGEQNPSETNFVIVMGYAHGPFGAKRRLRRLHIRKYTRPSGRLRWARAGLLDETIR